LERETREERERGQRVSQEVHVLEQRNTCALSADERRCVHIRTYMHHGDGEVLSAFLFERGLLTVGAVVAVIVVIGVVLVLNLNGVVLVNVNVLGLNLVLEESSSSSSSSSSTSSASSSYILDLNLNSVRANMHFIWPS
jgi:hypothetical protein